MHVEQSVQPRLEPKDLSPFEQALILQFRKLRDDRAYGKLIVIVQDSGICHVEVTETMKPEKLIRRQLTIL